MEENKMDNVEINPINPKLKQKSIGATLSAYIIIVLAVILTIKVVYDGYSNYKNEVGMVREAYIEKSRKFASMTQQIFARTAALQGSLEITIDNYLTNTPVQMRSREQM